MYRIVGYIVFLSMIIAGGLYLVSGTLQVQEGPVVIFTQVPTDGYLSATDPVFRPTGYNGSRIVSLNYENGGEEPKNLTTGFYAAAFPSLSYDNSHIVFSGKQHEEDPWQIWMMNRDGSGKRKVLDSEQGDLMPAFLPNGKIIFSRETSTLGIGSAYALNTCQPDGSELEQITFHPHRDLYTSVLQDGRVATVSQQIYPGKTPPIFMVLRPDGTKAQAFYHEQSGQYVKSIIRETTERKLIFVRGDEDIDQLVALSYADPGRSARVIISSQAGSLQSADVLPGGGLVVARRASEEEVFGLYKISFDGMGEKIYSDSSFHSIEPVAVRKKAVPPRLPSSVSNEKKFGILVGQNPNQSQIQLDGNLQTKYIRILGIDRTLDVVPVADDGSFYLKVQSGMPFRFQSLNEKKEVLRGPSAWIWLRPGERRGCVGCHTNNTLSPVNIVPKAIHSQPGIIVDTTRVINEEQAQEVRRIFNEMKASTF